jgi:hypothetical protein
MGTIRDLKREPIREAVIRPARRSLRNPPPHSSDFTEASSLPQGEAVKKNETVEGQETLPLKTPPRHHPSRFPLPFSH